MKVIKFGGSSVGTPERITGVIEIIQSIAATDASLAVVVSAFSGVTDQLIKAANKACAADAGYETEYSAIKDRHDHAIVTLLFGGAQKHALEELETRFHNLKSVLRGIYLVQELTPRTLDLVCSFGERLSAYVLAQTLSAQGIHAEYLDAREVIKTDESFGNAIVNQSLTKQNIRAYFSEHKTLQIITGFIASTVSEETTTLGRGGSDYTAAIVASALDAQEIQIWTDVDGVMTADPRVVKKALTIGEMTYKEAMELSHFGAKVIYPPTMQPALDAKIPIRIKNTFNSAAPGTLVSDTKRQSEFPLTGISSIDNISLLQLEGSGMIGVAGVAKRLFAALSEHKVNVILISQASSEHSICVAIDPAAAELAKRAVEEEFSLELKARQIDNVRIESGLAIIAVVGENMKHSPGLSGRVFQALGRNGINVVAIAQGSSELNISIVIEKPDVAKALNALHDAFFLSDVKTIHVFLVGTGNVGRTLIGQLCEHRESLQREHQIEIKVSGLSNSKQMLFEPEGISLETWQEELAKSSTAAQINEFVSSMNKLNLSNSIFVDCTASQTVAAVYNDVLSSSISVITPNKRANSGSFDTYKALKKTAKKANVSFYYETNVGAGLPVISTLNDLLRSGDEIIKIEAVLSGTLSYLFNSFKTGVSFSQIVREAKERGFTEPDPRDDLSGTDVARKLMILAREIGVPLEEDNVLVESLIPACCKNAASVQDFFEKLPEADREFGERLRQAADAGRVLRYIGQIEGGKASVSLEAVDSSHPFYSLSGSDNIISFRTKRYDERPLVVKGPGAGTDVTAAGVFADIVRAASYLGQ